LEHRTFVWLSSYPVTKQGFGVASYVFLF